MHQMACNSLKNEPFLSNNILGNLKIAEFLDLENVGKGEDRSTTGHDFVSPWNFEALKIGKLYILKHWSFDVWTFICSIQGIPYPWTLRLPTLHQPPCWGNRWNSDASRTTLNYANSRKLWKVWRRITYTRGSLRCIAEKHVSLPEISWTHFAPYPPLGLYLPAPSNLR